MLHIIIEYILGWNFAYDNQYFLNLAPDYTYFETKQVTPSIRENRELHRISQTNRGQIFSKYLCEVKASIFKQIWPRVVNYALLGAFLVTFCSSSILERPKKWQCKNRAPNFLENSDLYFSKSVLRPAPQCILNT